MRQVFRLMDMPDKVIAFDGLPEEMLNGIELNDCSKLPKDWREFIGYREKVVNIKPEIDPITKQWVKSPPLVLKAPYAYLIDREVNQDRERWQEILAYVRRHAPVSWPQNGENKRLLDDIEKMAKPLARDVHSEIDLEPEDVIVIPLNQVMQEGEPKPVAVPQFVPVAVRSHFPPPDLAKVSSTPIPVGEDGYPQPLTITTTEKPNPMAEPKCLVCEKVFSSKQAVRMHMMKKHPEPVKTAAA